MDLTFLGSHCEFIYVYFIYACARAHTHTVCLTSTASSIKMNTSYIQTVGLSGLVVSELAIGLKVCWFIAGRRWIFNGDKNP
jgi:hypothetical protein